MKPRRPPKTTPSSDDGHDLRDAASTFAALDKLKDDESDPLAKAGVLNQPTNDSAAYDSWSDARRSGPVGMRR